MQTNIPLHAIMCVSKYLGAKQQGASRLSLEPLILASLFPSPP